MLLRLNLRSVQTLSLIEIIFRVAFCWFVALCFGGNGGYNAYVVKVAYTVLVENVKEILKSVALLKKKHHIINQQEIHTHVWNLDITKIVYRYSNDSYSRDNE